MLLQQKQEMYLSLNFRWPVLMGSEASDATLPVSNSAFRSVPPSALPAPAHTAADTSAPGPAPSAVRSGPLPPISCLKEAAGRGQEGLRAGLHHPEPLLPPGVAGKGLASAGRGLLTTAGTSPPHPAFPLPSLLPHPAAAGHPPPPPPPPQPQQAACQLSQLQQSLLAVDKALGLPPYLHDPLAKAALLDLHGRLQAGAAPLGQYPLGKKLFGCPQCRYITDRKNNLKRHIATMHQDCDKVLECCGVVFKNKASLRDHVLIFHSNGYMCRYCGRNFCRKALLKRHLTVHSGQKDFLCGQCDYATSHKSNLERHKRVHERQALGEDVDDDVDDVDEVEDEVEVGEVRHPYPRLPHLPPHSAVTSALPTYISSLPPAVVVPAPARTRDRPSEGDTPSLGTSSGGSHPPGPRTHSPPAEPGEAPRPHPPHPDLARTANRQDEDEDEGDEEEDDPGSVLIDVVNLVTDTGC